MADDVEEAILNPPTIRLTATADASYTSTGHAFQIGATSSSNLIMDANEIITRNNGAAATLIINGEGGNVTLGADTSTVTIPGHVNSPNLPWSMASGTRSWVIPSGATGTVSVNYPTGRFSQPPNLMFAVNGGTPQLWDVSFVSNTTSSFTLVVFNGSGTSATASITWTAVQMTSSNASG